MGYEEQKGGIMSWDFFTGIIFAHVVFSTDLCVTRKIKMAKYFSFFLFFFIGTILIGTQGDEYVFSSLD